jgi:hypothetical protein
MMMSKETRKARADSKNRQQAGSSEQATPCRYIPHHAHGYHYSTYTYTSALACLAVLCPCDMRDRPKLTAAEAPEGVSGAGLASSS